MQYRKYSKKEMLKIINEVGIVFVETAQNDAYVISKNDIADFIMYETKRVGQTDMEFYMPGLDYPVITTNGCYLDKANPKLREEIIERLILLQTTSQKPKKLKVFNNDIFNNMSTEELGIDDGKVRNFDKLYKDYKIAQDEHIKILKQSPLYRDMF